MAESPRRRDFEYFRQEKRMSVRLMSIAAIASVVLVETAAPRAQTDLEARARAIHDRVIALDTHNDIDPQTFTADCNYTMRLTTQVNLPKMKAGGLDVSFFIVYVGQGDLNAAGYDRAYRAAIAKFDAIHRLTEQIAPQEIELALTPADVVRIAKSGKKVAVIGIENGYPIGMDLKRVKEFYDRGGRYMSLAHNGHNQLADSHTGEAGNEWKWGGLSPLGREALQEMNRLGMMVDVSHPSKASILQAIGLSKAPVIASHSSVRRLANQSRNLDDEMLMAIKTNGGVVQINAVADFIKADPKERAPALAGLRDEFALSSGRGGGAGATAAGRGPAAPPAFKCPMETSAAASADAGGGGRAGRGAAGPETLSADRRAEFDRRMAEIDRQWPAAGRATVKDYVDHIDYAVKLAGIDHVGIASDFDGGGGVDGWNSAADTFNVTLELVRRGYTEEQIAKIWSGNLLRVWSDVEKIAKQIQTGRR
jgi:membrane dipeptidase